MRVQKITIGVVLGSMLLGMAGSIVARQNAAYPPGQAIEAKLTEFKTSLARAVAAAEKDVSGAAKSVRIDRSHGAPRWIIGVDTAGKIQTVVVDHQGTVIGKAAPAEPTAEPHGAAPSANTAATIASGKAS